MLSCDLEEERAALGIVLPVPDFEPGEPGLHELLDDILCHPTFSARPGMREHRDATRPADQPDGVERARRVVRDVVPTAPVEDRLERGHPTLCDTFRDERVCDVRAADSRPRLRDREHVVPVEVVVGSDHSHHALGARDSRSAHLLHLRKHDLVGGIDEVAKHMHARVVQLRGELDSGDERHPGLSCRDACLGPASGRVVVGEGDHVEACLRCLSNDLARRFGAIRDHGMSVEVDAWLVEGGHAPIKAQGAESSTPCASQSLEIPGATLRPSCRVLLHHPDDPPLPVTE